MRPRFLRAGEPVPPRSLVVDCGLAGAATYSHWQGAPATPSELLADSSTAIVLNAARDPARWLSGFDWVVNDHIDADGLLAMAVACHPELAQTHAELLIGAAEAGDFSAWPGEAAFRLMLRLHRHIADAKETGDSWEQLAIDRLVDQLPSMIAESADERFTAIARQVQRQRTTLSQDAQLISGEHVNAYAWKEIRGHASDSFLWTGEADDLPPWVHMDSGNADQFHLLAMTPLSKNGTIYHLLAPGHSWARTVRRPQVHWPELGELARTLQQLESAPGRWICGPAARAHGFVCQLTFVQVGCDVLMPSSLPVSTVLPLVDQALGTSR